MPVLFIGHGSPMNAIESNIYTDFLSNLSTKIKKPKAILCVSAHWLTSQTQVTGMLKPRTIYDFNGFPKKLYDVRYPAPGSLELAQKIQKLISSPVFIDENNWGLDHGAWSILKHLYPKAEIPVLQLSISMQETSEYHYNVGKELQSLRNDDVLLIGSGNIVHNLKQINWETDAPAYDWAVQFDRWVSERLMNRDDDLLCNEYLKAPGGLLSVPTSDHYLPLLYILGAADKNERLSILFEGMQNASISMRSFAYGI